MGLVLPSVQVVTEPLFNRLVGGTQDFLASRVLLQGATAADLVAMEEQVPRAIEELATANVDLLVSCCTASGAIRGLPADLALCQDVQLRTGIPMTTTMSSIVRRLRALRVDRLTVVTPYLPELAAVEHRYLSANGFEVVAAADQGIADGFAMSEVDVEEIIELALATWVPDSDALLLSCMNWPATDAVDVLRARTGKPVVTSHTATLWDIRRMLSREFEQPSQRPG